MTRAWRFPSGLIRRDAQTSPDQATPLLGSSRIDPRRHPDGGMFCLRRAVIPTRYLNWLCRASVPLTGDADDGRSEALVEPHDYGEYMGRTWRGHGEDMGRIGGERYLNLQARSSGAVRVSDSMDRLAQVLPETT